MPKTMPRTSEMLNNCGMLARMKARGTGAGGTEGGRTGKGEVKRGRA